MIAPFLDLLFLKDEAFYKEKIAGGVPQFTLSAQSLIDNFYYYITQIILNPTQGKAAALMYICVLVVILFLLKNLFRYLAMYVLANVRNGVVKDIRNGVHQKLMRLPLSYYNEERKGDIISRITTDVAEVEWSVMSSLEIISNNS